MNIFKRIFKCSFSEPKCKESLLGCKCGKGGSTVIQAPQQAPAPSIGETSQQVYDAKLANDPRMAQLSYDILTNPNYGLGATTGYLEQQRQELFPGENQVRQALQQQVLQGLQSPTGLTPDQQASIDQRRALATSRMQEASRNNANLGGNLYGGRSQRAEMEDVGNLQNQFAEEDINREQTARNNSIQAALPFLQILFPDVGLTPPQFESAVPSGGAAYQGLLSARGQDMNYAMNNAQLQQQSANNRTALRSSLYGGLGQAAGGFLGGAASAGGLFMCWVAAEIFGGWLHPKTCLARNFIGTKAPSWFRDFYIENGEVIARFIKDKPILKSMLKPLFELFARLGR